MCLFQKLLLAELFTVKVGKSSPWVLVLYLEDLCARWVTLNQWVSDFWTAQRNVYFLAVSFILCFPWLKHLNTNICRPLNSQHVVINLRVQRSCKTTQVMSQTFNLRNIKIKTLLGDRSDATALGMFLVQVIWGILAMFWISLVCLSQMQRSDPSIRGKSALSTFQRHGKEWNVAYLISGFAGFCWVLLFKYLKYFQVNNTLT